jgi:DNA-binding transcriptional LysR family regulator
MRVNGNLSMTNGEHILRAAINGGGIAMLSGYITGRQIRDGRLVSILDEYVVEQDPIYAVYPSKKNLSPKIKTFIDYLIKLYSPNPYWVSSDKVNLTARNRSLI